jgi:hypothetical protein
MADDYGVLRIEVDGEWTPTEFSKLCDEFEVLNEMAAYGDASQDEQQARILLEWRSFIPGRPLRFSPTWTQEYELEIETEDYFREIALRKFMTQFTYIPPLRLKAIRFASPGFVDLLGAGRVIGHISKFILGITDRYLAREERALAREQTKQRILKQKIANAEGLLRLGSKVHMDPEAKRQLVRRALEIDEYIESNLIEQKITAAREVGPGDTLDGVSHRGRPRR